MIIIKKERKKERKMVNLINMFCKCFVFRNALKKEKIVVSKADKFIDNTDYSTIEYKDTICFVPPITHGKVIKVYDGDTITICARFYEGSPLYRFSIRLRGIDSPEIRGKSEKEKEMGIKSRDALHILIYGKIITLRNLNTEKYGRVLADIYLEDLHINQWLLDNHYAIPYDGGKKMPFSE